MARKRVGAKKPKEVEMTKFEVSLARLVREIRTVEIEMPEETEDADVCAAAWEKVDDDDDDDDDDDGWVPDNDWGYDEGTHVIIGRKPSKIDMSGEEMMPLEDGNRGS